MPIFSRRQIQQMVDETRHLFGNDSVDDIIKSIESGDRQSIQKEWELYFIWLFSYFDITHEESYYALKIDDVIIPIYKFMTKFIKNDIVKMVKPDITIKYKGNTIVADICSLNIDSFKGRDLCLKIARNLDQQIRQIGFDRTDELFYWFKEDIKDAYKKGKRFPKVPADGKLTDLHKKLLTEWKIDGFPLNFQINADELNVEISNSKQPGDLKYRIHSPVALSYFDAKKNPVFNAVKGKYQKQLRFVSKNFVRGVFITDENYNELQYFSGNLFNNRVTAKQIISECFREFSIDFIVLSYGKRIKSNDHSFISAHDQGAPCVESQVFVNPQRGISPEVRELIYHLDGLVHETQREPYQAHSLLSQGALRYKRKRRRYAMQRVATKGQVTEISVSARLLADLLLGQISHEDIERSIDNTLVHVYRNALSNGDAVIDVKFEPGSILDDDDAVKIYLGPDPSRSRLE